MTHMPGYRDSIHHDSNIDDPQPDLLPSQEPHPGSDELGSVRTGEDTDRAIAEASEVTDAAPRAVMDDEADQDDRPKRTAEAKPAIPGQRRLPARRGLSDNELAIMTILWREGETTGRSIAESFPHKVAYTTILTYLKRLEGKGYVSTVKAGRAHRFSASIPREEVVSDMLTRAVYALDADFPALMQFALEHGHVPASLVGKLEGVLHN